MADSKSLSPDEIADQASALAEHLQRSGVQFLPAIRPDVVQQLSTQFEVPSEVDASANTPVGQPRQPLKQSPPLSADKAPPPMVRPAVVKPAAVKSAATAVIDAVQENYPGEPLPIVDRQQQLDQMANEVAVCTRCEVLASCRTNTVFGEGSAQPRFAFFGEGPGADEDRTGRPFVGKAGQLLTKMIEACSFRREDVYILNTVKCRPPGNRNPEPGEIDHCREYFQRQLSILRPEYIVCLGAISSQTLLQSKLSVGRLRGKFHRYFESKVLVTYHPAYLLRTPAAKKAAWEDLQLMLRDAGIDPKAKQ